MNLPTVTYLFKERGINAHGMSTTRRHLLSPLEKNLSNFLYVTDLEETIKIFNLYYTDEVFSSKKIDFQLYKNISKIQEYNLKKRSNIIKEIESRDSIASQEFKDISNNKSLGYLINKLNNLENNSMNPLVLILLLRNYIFELEKMLNDKKGSHKDLLTLYNNNNLEVEKLIKQYDDHQITINKLQSKVEELILGISQSDEIIKIKQKAIIENKSINLENKQKRKIAAKNNKLNKSKKKM